jgi:glycosyltransferase involved in cell wall biosynthesis
MEDYRFSIVALIAEKTQASKRKYKLPENAVSYQEYVIFDKDILNQGQSVKLSRKKWRTLSDGLYRLMNEWKQGRLSEESLDLIREIIMRQSPNIFKNFIEDEKAFALMTRIYEDLRGDSGFVKYFYNCHSIHLVLFRLLALVGNLPDAPIYHSPGTGYAGFIACLRSVLYGGASIITEHGIYLQEREMELLRSDWLDNPYLKDMWVDMFSSICRWQYNTCDTLITLTQTNKALQIEYGADPARIQVVSNGIDIERFREARRYRCIQNPRTVAFVGRVDGVKDVKTFIQAISIIKKGYPEIRSIIIGPFDEQPTYYKECRQLTDILELNDTISFTGRADVLDYYKKMDILLLTSIKEAMPLVVMEAMASGIPVVATSVGACKELLYGIHDGIGPAGVVVRVMDAEEIADATIRLLKDPGMANTMARNGIERIERFYREELVIKEYQRIYQEALDGGRHISARKAS